MTEELLRQCIERCLRHFKTTDDLMHGFIVTSDDKVFVDWRGRFIFDTPEAANRAFYSDSRHLCTDGTRTDWERMKREMHIRTIQI